MENRFINLNPLISPATKYRPYEPRYVNSTSLMDIRHETLVLITGRIKLDTTTVRDNANKTITIRTAEDQTDRDLEQLPQAKDQDTPKDPVNRKETAGHVAPPTTIRNTAPRRLRPLKLSGTERIHPEEGEETNPRLISITTKMGPAYDTLRQNMGRFTWAPHPRVWNAHPNRNDPLIRAY